MVLNSPDSDGKPTGEEVISVDLVIEERPAIFKSFRIRFWSIFINDQPFIANDQHAKAETS